MYVGAVCRFAFVEFSSQDDATKAMESLQGTDIDGRNVRLDYAADRNGGGGGGGGFGGRGGTRYSLLL